METITKEKKRYFAKWTVIAGLLCGILAAAVLLITQEATLTDGSFWSQVFIVAGGGGYALGFLPAAVMDFRKSKEADHGSV